MNINTNDMVANEARKAGLLLAHAGKIGMNLGGYGELAVNQNSGNVYLWLEDYNFCLFVGLSNDDKVEACYSCPVDGEETMVDADEMSLDELEAWAQALAEESDSKE